MKKFSNTEAELKKALLIKKRVPQKLVVKINQLSTPICGLLRTLCKSVILPHLNHLYEVSVILMTLVCLMIWDQNVS